MIVVARTYTPKAGASGLVGLLKSVNDQNIANSLPALKIYRKFLGAHGVIVTTQEWDSLEKIFLHKNHHYQNISLLHLLSKYANILDMSLDYEVLL